MTTDEPSTTAAVPDDAHVQAVAAALGISPEAAYHLCMFLALTRDPHPPVVLDVPQS